MNIIIRVFVALVLCLSGIAHAIEYNPKAGDGVERAAKALNTTPAAFIEANKAKLKAPNYWLYLGEKYNVPSETVASREVKFDKATALVRKNAAEAKEMARTATVAEAIQAVQKQLTDTRVAPIVGAGQVAEAAPKVRRAQATQVVKQPVRTDKVFRTTSSSNDWSLPYREAHFGTTHRNSVEKGIINPLGLQSVGGHWSTRTSSPDALTQSRTVASPSTTFPRSAPSAPRKTVADDATLFYASEVLVTERGPAHVDDGVNQNRIAPLSAIALLFPDAPPSVHTGLLTQVSEEHFTRISLEVGERTERMLVAEGVVYRNVLQAQTSNTGLPAQCWTYRAGDTAYLLIREGRSGNWYGEAVRTNDVGDTLCPRTRTGTVSLQSAPTETSTPIQEPSPLPVTITTSR